MGEGRERIDIVGTTMRRVVLESIRKISRDWKELLFSMFDCTLLSNQFSCRILEYLFLGLRQKLE